MEIDELLKLQPNDLITEVRSKKQSIDHHKYANQYDPEKHNVHDLVLRPKKQVSTTDGGLKSVDVSRLSIPFQQIIVDRAAAFLIGEGIKRISQPENENEQLLVDMIDKTWFDNKLDYQTREMARRWMSETEVAELWYFKEKDAWQGFKLGSGGKFVMRMQILAPSEGDGLYPYFDQHGDMTAFGRSYRVNKIEHFDLYTEKIVRKYKKEIVWTHEEEKNLLEKIPVIYYSRAYPEWHHVQHLIERFETMLSNFADSNDYFASPMVKIRGVVTGFADKGEQGKVLIMEENADASYLTWDQAPEAIKLEKETLQELIFSMTQTPDISFQQMKGIGTVSGVALKLMFLDADLKAKKHTEQFGEGVQRRINLLKKGMSIIHTGVEAAQNLQVEPEFVFYLPANDQELINMLVTAAGSKAIMSQKTAVSMNPFVLNTDKEMEEIKEDEAGQFGNIFDET